jgi:(2Fe-2S) ferredoxin
MQKKYFFIWEPGDGKQQQCSNSYVKILNEKNASKKADVVKSRFLGFSSTGPIVRVVPGDFLYAGFSENDISPIIEATLAGSAVERLL